MSLRKTPGRRQNDWTSGARRSASLGSTEDTPRTLIQGYMESADTAAPSVRHKRRVSDRMSTSHPAVLSGRRSVPGPAGNRSLNLDKDTPRTLLQNYLHNVTDVIETPYSARPAAVQYHSPNMVPSQGSYRTPSPFQESSKSSMSLPYSSAHKARSRINTGRFQVAEVRSPTSSSGSVLHSQEEEDLGVFDSSNEEEGQTDGHVPSRQHNMEHTRHGTFRIPQIPQQMMDMDTDNFVDESSYGDANDQQSEYVAQLSGDVAMQSENVALHSGNVAMHSGNVADGHMVEPYNLYEIRMESVSGNSQLEDKENMETMSSASMEMAVLYRGDKQYDRDSFHNRGGQGQRMSADRDAYVDFAADGNEKLSFRNSASPVIDYQDGRMTERRGRWSDGQAGRFGEQLNEWEHYLKGRLSEGHQPGIDVGDRNYSPLSNNSSVSKSRVGEGRARRLSGVSIDTEHRRVRHSSGETLGSERSRHEQSLDGVSQDGSPHWVDMRFSSGHNSMHQQMESPGLQGHRTAESHTGDHSRIRHSSGETLGSERGRPEHTPGQDRNDRRSGSDLHSTVHTEPSPWLRQQHAADQHSAGQVLTLPDSSHILMNANMDGPVARDRYTPMKTINDIELSSRSRMFTPTNSNVSFNAHDLITPGKVTSTSKDTAKSASANQTPEPMSHDGTDPGTTSRRRSGRLSEVGSIDGTDPGTTSRRRSGRLSEVGSVDRSLDKSGAPQNKSHLTKSMDRPKTGNRTMDRSLPENFTGSKSRLSSRSIQELHSVSVMQDTRPLSSMQDDLSVSLDSPKSGSVLMTPRGSIAAQEHGSVARSTRSTRSKHATEMQETSRTSVPMDSHVMTGASVPEDNDEPVPEVSDGEDDDHVTNDEPVPKVSDGEEDDHGTNGMVSRAIDGPVPGVGDGPDPGTSDGDDNQWEDDEMAEPSSRSKLAVSSSKTKKPATRRKPRKPSAYSMPVSLVKKEFCLFGGMRVEKDAIEEVMKASEMYWDNLAKDLEAYALHAGRKTIQMEDFNLLFRRQGLVNDKCSLDSLIHKYLPMEEQNKLIHVARAGNVIEPKL